MTIVEWNAAAVRDHFAAILAERLALAGKFVEETARGNLAAINDPDWGEGYRNEVVGRMLTSVVIKDNKGLSVQIGVRRSNGRGGDSHGFYIETGSSTAPAHPWLRPALFEHGRDIQQILEGR